MADTVDVDVIHNDKQTYVIHLTNISDGTGEANVTKIDRSALTNTNGVAPIGIDILEVRWAIQGMTYVKLSWDHTTDDVALLLTGSGYDNFGDFSGLKDPRSSVVSGASGDLLLTTIGAAATGTYDITLVCRLQ